MGSREFTSMSQMTNNTSLQYVIIYLDNMCAIKGHGRSKEMSRRKRRTYWERMVRMNRSVVMNGRDRSGSLETSRD